MNPNGRFTRNLAKPGELSNAQGAPLANKAPVPIPWNVFLTCGIRVILDGKPVVFILEPQTAETVDEAVELLLLLFGMLSPKSGPLDWATVPEYIRRHFREVTTTPHPS